MVASFSRYSSRAKIVAAMIVSILLAAASVVYWKVPGEKVAPAPARFAAMNKAPVKNVSTLSASELADIPPEAFTRQPPADVGYNAHSGGLPPGALPPGVVLPGQPMMQGGQGYGGYDGVRQKFTSKERDIETGLDYSMHRYYSNVQGRFTSVDPENAGAYPGNPQTWNGYSYALNQPMLYSDPDGLKVRVCGTDGQCTDSNTDLTDEQWNNWFGRDKSVKLQGGNIYKNGELIGTYQQLSCDSCYYDIFELGRQVTRADPGGRAVRLYGKAALAGLTLPGTAAGWISIGVFSVIVPVYNEPDEDVFAASIQADRQAAVRDAWKQEAERARTGQPTKTPFTADELRELRDTGRVSGYEGHHTESVSGNPQSARDASKIEFVKGRAAHLSEHGGNWRNRTPLPKRR